MSFVMLMSDLWKVPKEGLVACQTNLLIRGLELSVPATDLQESYGGERLKVELITNGQ